MIYPHFVLATASVRRDRRGDGSLRILGSGHFARRRHRGVRSALSRPKRRREYFRRDEEPMGLGRLHDARSCALPACGAAHRLVYNWWNIFVRLADPSLHREAITSRPLFLTAIATRTTGKNRRTPSRGPIFQGVPAEPQPLPPWECPVPLKKRLENGKRPIRAPSPRRAPALAGRPKGVAQQVHRRAEGRTEAFALRPRHQRSYFSVILTGASPL
jgi:hypothetical protein